jgi:cell division protein FtsQ
VKDERPVVASEPPSATTKRRRRWQIPAAIAFGVFMVLLAPLWAPLFLRRMAFFHVRHIEIVGAHYVQPREIYARLRIDTNASVWDASGPLEKRVRQHPLVQDVEIDRKLPGTLVVRLVEHAPVALVPTTDGLRALDERGVALPIDPTTADVDVPILARADTVMLRLLASARRDAPGVYGRVSEVRAENDEVVFMFDALPVRAPHDVTLQQLQDVELVEQDLARRRLRAIELDLRYRDQVIARLQ